MNFRATRAFTTIFDLAVSEKRLVGGIYRLSRAAVRDVCFKNILRLTADNIHHRDTALQFVTLLDLSQTEVDSNRM